MRGGSLTQRAAGGGIRLTSVYVSTDVRGEAGVRSVSSTMAVSVNGVGCRKVADVDGERGSSTVRRPRFGVIVRTEGGQWGCRNVFDRIGLSAKRGMPLRLP